jgi:hypothetical protein
VAPKKPHSGDNTNMRDNTEQDGCRCGSGLQAYAISDARGIPIGLACGACETKLKSRYRPDIFDDPDYECDEQIEPD